jgi:purine nucleosidase
MIFYLDCDTGVDDALALAVLLSHPDVRIAGIGTVSGNTTAQQAAANTLNLLAVAGRTGIPLAVGARHPLAGERVHDAADVHGDNGIGGVQLPGSPEHPIDAAAADLLVELARAYGKDLHVLATGPLTNLAQALAKEPNLGRMVGSVTAMGGSVRVPGNVTPHAEANIWADPEAAEAVFAGAWPVTLVPLDVTMDHRFAVADQDALAAGPPFQQALAAMLTRYFDFYEPRLGERRTPLHDPLAAVIALGEVTLGDAPSLGLRVDLTEERGRLIEDPSAPAVRVVLSLTADAAPVIRAAALGV